MAQISENWPDLARVVKAWPDLPEAVRAGIVAMVKVVEQVALTWLRLQILEQHYTQSTMTTANPLTRETGDFWDRRLSAAQRRHLRACETLARIRKIGVAAVQVNIADQQVNIAGGS